MPCNTVPRTTARRQTERMRHRRESAHFLPALALLLLAGLAWEARAGEVPYGHADFYPSSERPLGWRADGSGAWPGATPVTTWDAESGSNVVWRTPMPAAGMNVPLVVGEKVFALADPNLLVCVNVHNGEILWQRAVDHTEAMPPAGREEARAAIAAYEAEVLRYHAWREEVVTLAAALAKHGCTSRDLATKKGMVAPGESAKVDAALEAAGVREDYVRLQAQGQAAGYALGMSGNEGPIDGNNPRLREMQKNLMTRFSYHAWSHWYGFVTKTYASPCSDGESVYVSMSQHQAACYDLEGNRRWLTWTPPEWTKPGHGTLGTRFVSSPLLHGRYLITRQDGEYLVYDKTDGRLLWRRRTRNNEKISDRPNPEAGHPVAGSLALPEGELLDILVGCDGEIYRLTDGKVLCDQIPAQLGISSNILSGDYWVGQSEDFGKKSTAGYAKRSNGNIYLGGGYCYRLRATAPDRVEPELLWHVREAGGSLIVHGGRVFDSNGVCRDLASGAEIWKGASFRTHYCWPSMGGMILMANGDAHARGDGDKKDGKVVMTLVDAASGKRLASVENAFFDRRVVDDPGFRSVWRYRGSMSFIATHSCSFQANRIFRRTMGYLWCIGDPKQPFPVPRGCPAPARIAK